MHHEVLDHNCKKSDFVSFIERLELPRGMTLLMDNIQFHKSNETVAALQSKGFQVLYTPPYSPRFNPIENVFGVVKTAYRSECPCAIDVTFDYEALLHTVVLMQDDFHGAFDHAARSVSSALSAPVADSHGYDD
jgi:hypothetical protein